MFILVKRPIVTHVPKKPRFQVRACIVGPLYPWIPYSKIHPASD